MNVMHVLESAIDRPVVETRPAARMVSSGLITLRKSGSRPVSFSGRHLAFFNGYRAGTPLWHELNLYQTDDGRFVGEIRVYTKAEGSSDQFHVLVGDGLEEVLSFFEGYAPKRDVMADFDIFDPELAPAELMVQAAALKYRIAETENQYRAVLSGFLKDLNNG